MVLFKGGLGGRAHLRTVKARVQVRVPAARAACRVRGVRSRWAGAAVVREGRRWVLDAGAKVRRNTCVLFMSRCDPQRMYARVHDA